MNVLVIDTETANEVETPMPYDVGYQIMNTETGEIFVQRSFVVAEIFLDKELMASAYFAEKVPNYWEDLKAGRRVMKGIFNIRKQIRQDMKNYNVRKVGAYNMGFDRRATHNDIRYISGSMVRWFFPYGTEYFCIWNMACTSILNTEDYVNFCLDNNFVTNCDNVQTSAEVAYRFITNNVNFIEEHTGLEDVTIECEILKAILNSGMDYQSRPYSGCWRIVQKKREEMGV